MNNLQMREEVIRMLGNFDSSHPMYVDVQTWVNRGISDVVLMGIRGLKVGIDLFPELRCSWLSDLTVTGINQQELPDDKLLITGVGSFDSATLPNQNFDRALPMSYIEPEMFDIITKSTQVGFPRIYTFRGGLVRYHPTPAATPIDYRTYLIYWGVERDPFPPMSGDDDTPKLLDVWHDACVNRAAAIGARKMGWTERAALWDSECKSQLGYATNIGAAEDSSRSSQLTVDGLIQPGELYG